MTAALAPPRPAQPAVTVGVCPPTPVEGPGDGYCHRDRDGWPVDSECPHHGVGSGRWPLIRYWTGGRWIRRHDWRDDTGPADTDYEPVRGRWGR